jgi:hypothetical protein
MKLSNGQQEKSIGLRGLLNSPRPADERGWSAFMDFTRALGKMLDGLDAVQSPGEMKDNLNHAWNAYAKYWGYEHERLLLEALGNDEMLLNRIKEHENGRRIVNRIIDRVRKQHGGVISSEANASSVEITDILVEEIGEDEV